VFERGAINQLTQHLGREFTAWLGTTLSTDTVTSSAWAATRLALVSSRASVARGCYGGKASDCVAVLGLRPSKDPYVDWYAAASRRDAVLQFRDFALARNAYDRCLAGEDAACLLALRAAEFDRSRATLFDRRWSPKRYGSEAPERMSGSSRRR